MTREHRDALKAAIDARRRELLAAESRERARSCSGCGGDLETRTTGCKACWDRHRRRRRREDPAKREHDRQKWRESRARRRARKAAA